MVRRDLHEAGEAKTCPRCGERGSKHTKTVKNTYGKPYHYTYFAHYNGVKGKTRKIKWCYIGKETIINEQSGKERKRKKKLPKGK
ncbi:MAG: hypothetical protein ACK4TI_01160 [Nitrososphaerales archaeon]